MKFRISIFILLFFVFKSTQAQVGDEVFQDIPVYTDLKEAMKNPAAVQRLYLGKQKLKKVPEEVFQLKNLIELDLSHNKIKKIPAEIGKLRKLQSLNLKKNKIEEVPDEIGDLINLQKLDISQNDLFYLPATIGNLESLEILWIWDTNLSGLPESIKNCKNLKEVDMRVIAFSDAMFETIREMLPGVNVLLSEPCHCGPN